MSGPEKNVTAPEAQKKARWPTKAGFFSLLAFILLALMMGGAYFFLIKIDNRFISIVNRMQTQQQTLQNEINTLEVSTNKVEALEADLTAVKGALHEMEQFHEANKTAWTLAEARYLVKLANDNLQYTANIALAIKLLNLADQTLIGLTDPKIVPVRQALANDIAHLQSVPQVDVDGLYARLAALHGEIDQLPLIDQPSKSAPEGTAPKDDRPWWQRGLQASWDTLKSLVVVRYNQKGNLLLLPEQKVILYQNLHAAVAQAIWALLHGQQDIYLSSLEQIQTWVQHYFVADNVMTEAVLTQLKNLQNLYIRPASPTITALEAFQKIE